VRALLEKWNVRPRNLLLEITESVIMADVKRATEVLDDLKRSGVRFSIDDFGTGYSSLSNLRRLPVDELKIDRSFVMGVAGSEQDAAIVRLTVDLGHKLNLKVVAEGVEDEMTFRALAESGCDAAQGFYMARPMEADAFESWIHELPWGIQSAERHAAVEL